MKRNSLFLLLLLLAVCAWSVPARRATFTHTQKDGTVLTLMLVGDEHMHYYQNTATGEAMELHPDGDYYLIAPATLSARQQQADQRRAEANQERAKRLEKFGEMNRASLQTVDGPKKTIGAYPDMICNDKHVLVLLVQFQDVRFTFSHDDFDDRYNGANFTEDNHIGSVKQYFLDQSYNQFELTFDIVGPITVSENMEYYGGNSGVSGSDQRPAHMVLEAVNLAASQVDYSQYDWDDDGYVDQVFVIYAGYNEAQGASANTIWPHQWTIYSGTQTCPYYNGKWVNSYGCTSELTGGNESVTIQDGIGTFCHEFSHCLGYPDLYDVDYDTNGSGEGMGSYDLMSSGNYNGPNQRGEIPCGYSAYERWMAGWLEPVELSSPATISNMPALNDEGKAYIIYNDDNRDEYFMLENRQANRWFSHWRRYDCGHGLFVYHVDYLQSAWTGNSINKYSSHQRFTYVPADGSYDVNYLNDVWADFFTNNQYVWDKVTAFTPGVTHTSAGGNLFTASTSTQSKAVTNIAEVNGLINFDFMGGALYTITYNNSGDVTTWAQPSKGQSTTLPAAETEVPNFTFVGWATAQVEETADAPTLLTGTYTPTDDITLYAVYYNNKVYTSNPADYIPHGGTEDAQLYFPYIIRVGETFAGAKLNTDSDGALTYESSNPAVATVDPDTGEVTALTVGTAIITVTQSETTSYFPATAKYMVKVIGD